MIENSDEKKIEGKQTRLLFNEPVVDEVVEIEDICCLIPNSDISLCARRVFELAGRSFDRKFSTVTVLQLIQFLTGKSRRSALNNILEGMKRYGICIGCECGHSMIINKPSAVKEFLLSVMSKR